MLDQLMKLVEQHAGEAIVKNTAIPDKLNNAAMKEVASQILNGLQSQATGGNLQQIVSMFQNGGGNNIASNPVVANIISSVTKSLSAKFGVSPQAAQSIATSLLPTVMNQLVSKTNNPKDSSFDLSSILKTVSGNNGLDVGSLLGGNSNDTLGSLGNIASKLFGK